MSNVNTSFFNNPNGLRGLFSILLTATILTCCEIIFFYVVIAPDIQRKVEKNIKKIALNLSDSIAEKVEDTIQYKQEMQINGSPNLKSGIHDHLITSISKVDQFLNIFKTFEIRENNLVSKINMYTMLTGVIIILFLIMAIVYLFNRLQPMGGVTSEPVLLALLTVVILLGFQGYFYLFGLNYNIPGSLGQEELISLIGSKIMSSISKL